MAADSNPVGDGSRPSSQWVSEDNRTFDQVRFEIIDYDDGAANGLITCRIWNGLEYKRRHVCERSLCVFSIESKFRQFVVWLVEQMGFDAFILLLIMIGSLSDAIYMRRLPKDEGFNFFANKILDPILTVFFCIEFVLKVLSWGFVLDKKTYLRDLWNWLDFVVVISAIINYLPGFSGANFGFLRVFRVLRPLRSLNAVPKMKRLVNTAVKSLTRLNNVIIMGMFLFIIFAIIGLTLMEGTFYRQCYTTEKPVKVSVDGTECWQWVPTLEGRSCGGNYMCEDTQGFCGGHEEDLDEQFRPSFPGGKQGLAWCEGFGPARMTPEMDFINFDNIGAALLVVFQSMTVEGWTDIMYWAQDAKSLWIGTIYFLALIPVTSFFLLNVALAVVDEAREDLDNEAEREAELKRARKRMNTESQQLVPDDTGSLDEDPPLWWDTKPVRYAHALATTSVFQNTILFIIIMNVVVMCLERYPKIIWLEEMSKVCEVIFLVLFTLEMAIMISAMGPKGYLRDWASAFDGLIVCTSWMEFLFQGGGALSALRTLRLFRVLNKIAGRWRKFKALLAAMVQTAVALNLWLILFVIVLYIFTLMSIEFFANQFQFEDPDSFDKVTADHGKPWCTFPDGSSTESLAWNFRQDCIPRAHFDTFLWAFITVFQVMTGENWNTVMYAGMRGTSWVSVFFFMFLILFGQTLFLALFLSMLMATFDAAQKREEEVQAKKIKSKMSRRSTFGADCPKEGKEGMEGKEGLVAAAARLFFTKPASKVNAEDGDVTANMKESLQKGGKVVDVKPRTSSPSQDAPCCGLPGQPDPPDQTRTAGNQHMPTSSAGDDVVKCIKSDELDDEDEDALMIQELVAEPKQETPPSWPCEYSLLMFSKKNPIRIAAYWILNKELVIESQYVNVQCKIFDNLILLCIVLSTLTMAIDTPLSDPEAGFTRFLRGADMAFAIIFMLEMVVKLVALGLLGSKEAYLGSPWNWLDGIVVIVSILGFLQLSDPFWKTLRILRTFRPLRVVSRNQNLKVVVMTIFESLPELATVGCVAALFLLIFALVALNYLNGKLYQCEAGDNPVGYMRNLGENFQTPLCMGGQATDSVCPLGMYNDSSRAWSAFSTACAPTCTEWQRATADTPICLARCDPYESADPLAPESLCPRGFTKTEELPPVGSCALRPLTADEQRGKSYVDAMQRQLIMPCGGTTVHPNTGEVTRPSNMMTCRDAFCPTGVKEGRTLGCKQECENRLQIFCASTCQPWRDGTAEKTPQCEACLQECEASCQCSEYCQPMMKDAALCLEQGGSWGSVLSQNFNNIENSLLTLFEISTTEGWVDVMYAAVDHVDGFVQPIRDHRQELWGPFFVFFIFFFSMFIINLFVGVVVENFLTLKRKAMERGKTDIMVTKAQMKWYNHLKKLNRASQPYSLTNLQNIGKWRRMAYTIITNTWFERIIMGAIVIMTLMMCFKTFPLFADWWGSFLEGVNIFFAVLFTAEFLIKFFALHSAYFKDNWNKFDFTCVVATLCGLFANHALGLNVASITSVIRIFRIARLFRLLRFLTGLQKIFAALVLSVPKLLNVLIIWGLLLIMYSILGVGIFSTAKTNGDTLNAHGNFKNFFWSFLTLFRASTGEAWNEIMHDLARRPEDFFAAGDWCSPPELFDTDGKFSVLKGKCLIDNPNSCVISLFGMNIWPGVYWVTYTLLVALMIMNLVIAVILECYADGKTPDPEAKAIAVSLQVWREFTPKYDPDQTLTLPFPQAWMYVHECIARLFEVDLADLTGVTSSRSLPSDFRTIPMKYANVFRDFPVDKSNRVSWATASKQVMVFASLYDPNDSGPMDLDLISEIETTEKNLDTKKAAVMKKWEKRQTVDTSLKAFDLKEQVAAVKLQRSFRASRARTKDLHRSKTLSGGKDGKLAVVSPSESSEDAKGSAAREHQRDEAETKSVKLHESQVHTPPLAR